ncbi:hypothetical protein AKJ16_DCAP19127 [Drosera capensis]
MEGKKKKRSPIFSFFFSRLPNPFFFPCHQTRQPPRHAAVALSPPSIQKPRGPIPATQPLLGPDEPVRSQSKPPRIAVVDRPKPRSRWDKFPSFPAGDYEYIDVVFTDGDRLIIDVDFRSEFDLVRPTNSYKSVLQSLPSIYVGIPDRIKQIVAIVLEAALRKSESAANRPKPQGF